MRIRILARMGLVVSTALSCTSSRGETNGVWKSSVPEAIVFAFNLESKDFCFPDSNVLQGLSAGAVPFALAPLQERAFCETMVREFENDPNHWTEDGTNLVALSFLTLRRRKESFLLMDSLNSSPRFNPRTGFLQAILCACSGTNGLETARGLFGKCFRAEPNAYYAACLLLADLSAKNFTESDDAVKYLLQALPSLPVFAKHKIAILLGAYSAECPDAAFGKQVIEEVRTNVYLNTDRNPYLRNPETVWILWKARNRHYPPVPNAPDTSTMRIDLYFPLGDGLEEVAALIRNRAAFDSAATEPHAKSAEGAE